VSRIYLALAIFSFALLAINIALGLATGDYGDMAAVWMKSVRELSEHETAGEGGSKQALDLKQSIASARTSTLAEGRYVSIHMLVGIASALVAVLVNSISVTYFVGTSRWCREVVEAYHLDMVLIEQSQRLKRQTFPWALGGMLTIIGLVALGALSDPTVMPDPANPARHLFWRTCHFYVALLGTMFIGWSYLIQTQNVGANYRIIDQILADVRRIRADRGLD
jgi:hypothetical protein